MFATSISFHPSLIRVGKAGAYQMEPFTGLHSTSKLLALTTNIRIGWKWIEVPTLAYYDTRTITAVNSFIVLAPSVQFAIKEGTYSKALLVEKRQYSIKVGSIREETNNETKY